MSIFRIRRANSGAGHSARERGFSLLEMMVAFGILLIVIAVAVSGMISMQTRSFAETSKVDTVQETRDFIDQMVRDIHDVGYPPTRVIANKATCVGDASVACGIIQFSPTAIKYEGDLDGTGTVYQVWMQLVAPASGKCPCILQRGVVSKAAALAGTTPPYFTEVNGVLNSGDGTGASQFGTSFTDASYTPYTTSDVFDAYFNDGYLYASPSGTYSCNTVSDCSTIWSLQITANVVPTFMDPKTHTYPVYSITSKARLNN